MARAKSQRHRQKRSHHKSRRGGSWYNPLSWFEKEEPPSLFGAPEEKPLLQSVGEGAQELMQKADQKIVEASNALSSGVSSASQGIQTALNTDIPLTGEPAPQPGIFQPSAPATSFGGRKRKYRGGKGGLGLTYYASPVDGMKVAEPTYWEEYKGGARRRSRSHTQRKSRGRGRSRTRAKSQRRSRR